MRGAWLRYVPFPLGTVPNNIAARVLSWLNFFMVWKKKGGKTTSLPRLEKWYDKTKDERRIVGNPLFGLDAGNGILSRPMFVGTGLVAKNWLVAAKRS